MDITLIGAVKGEITYKKQEISALLKTPRVKLNHGTTFTGKPNTHIHSNDKNIIKINSKLNLDLKNSIGRATTHLEQEQKLQVHHPTKTWFVATINDKIVIGNITPHLTAVHIDTNLHHLKAIFELYFRVAQEFKLRLDEGLSNFAVTESGELYYIDDDLYRWDRFISCGQILGVYIRSLSWLTAELASKLGKIIRQLILKHFNDSQYLTVLAEQLRNVFLSKTQRIIANSLINVLNPQQLLSINLDKSRYIALLADIHANLPALETVLDFLESKHINRIIVLGDIVGYGKQPNACIETLKAQTNIYIIKGNHDHALATGKFEHGFSQVAQAALQWSQDKVSSDNKKWLLELPPMIRHKDWLAVHGAPVDPTFFNAYVYEMTYEDNLNELQNKKIPICFHGHTHIPGVYGRLGSHYDKHYIEETMELKQFTHTLICPGSVGIPRVKPLDAAQFAIYDKELKQIQFISLLYGQRDANLGKD
ncbi:metallophosphoesterase family protein [Candidatus Marithrix sp. Canyon 246]|uniref:metallophosphoesterase family protein n=1 Tax=Candidatus Marithrix sp. Canyon 246 TaxID=1827136 RepID=UPI000849F68F|nr:metallophosphoesterase family protein [Candidatus Marithrix sp. Canyon 246]